MIIINHVYNTHHFVRALVKLPTLGTFKTVPTTSAIASGVLDCSKGILTNALTDVYYLYITNIFKFYAPFETKFDLLIHNLKEG